MTASRFELAAAQERAVQQAAFRAWDRHLDAIEQLRQRVRAADVVLRDHHLTPAERQARDLTLSPGRGQAGPPPPSPAVAARPSIDHVADLFALATVERGYPETLIGFVTTVRNAGATDTHIAAVVARITGLDVTPDLIAQVTP